MNTSVNLGQTLPSSTKPTFKKLNPYEVYLVDKKGRLKKRICGTQLSQLPEGYVCTNDPGLGTDHPGYAQCNVHDRQITNSNNTGLWLKLNRDAGLPENLLGFLENAAQIEEKHMVSVDDDIRSLYAILLFVMQKRKDPSDGDKGYLTNSDIETILKIMDKILKAKELRIKLNKELHLDMSTVKSFVDQIFKIIVSSTAEPIGKRILTEILEHVIVPFKTKGRIVGKDFEYDVGADKLYSRIQNEPELVE